MLEYDDSILGQIKRELAIIWTAHKIHGLDGKMRIFSCRSQEMWSTNEPGFELWFGMDEIDKAVSKIDIFYKKGILPNSAFLLDPVVYKITSGEKPTPVGSGIVWTTVFCDKEKLTKEAVDRVEEIGVFTSPIHFNDRKNAGLKIIAFLKTPTTTMNKDIPPDGSIVMGAQELLDLININTDYFHTRHYLLSGLEYRSEGGSYQHPDFGKIFGNKKMSSSTDIIGSSIHLAHILDAGKCWNAYERSTLLYARYGVDTANLDRNLATKKAIDELVEKIKDEFRLIFHANNNHNIKGKIRLYTCPNQDSWRSKNQGIECWFDDTELDKAADAIRTYYNDGMLPNSPMLLDPVVYKEEKDCSHTPIGSAVIWSTSLSTGLENYNDESLNRINDMNLMTGLFMRAGDTVSGIKILGFLETPYMFTDEEIEEYKKGNVIAEKEIDEYSDEESEDDIVDTEEIIDDEEEENKDEIYEIEEVEKQLFAGRDVMEIRGVKDIFSLTNVNGDQFYNYYLLTGIEYLCTNGAFSNENFGETFGNTDEERDELIKKHTLSINDAVNAAKCWSGYDKLHPLWNRFGNDIDNLDKNLMFFNLCGRDLNLLSLTEQESSDEDEKFEFIVPELIAKSCVTLLVSTSETESTNLAHRLAIIAATDWNEDEQDKKWLGMNIDKKECKGLAIYFSGNDSSAIVSARAEVFDPENRAKRIMLKCSNDFGLRDDGTEASIVDFLKTLNKLPDVSMVIVDPAKKYLTGDESNMEASNEFFNAVESFSEKKECPVIVIHNIVKDAKPDNPKDIMEVLRGSSAFVDRPRVVIGFIEKGEKTLVGLSKNSIPPQVTMMSVDKMFTRDTKHLDLI